MGQHWSISRAAISVGPSSPQWGPSSPRNWGRVLRGMGAEFSTGPTSPRGRLLHVAEFGLGPSSPRGRVLRYSKFLADVTSCQVLWFYVKSYSTTHSNGVMYRCIILIKHFLQRLVLAKMRPINILLPIHRCMFAHVCTHGSNWCCKNV